MSESIKAKIAKLLNMTVENGCSEDEAETALRMAMSAAARAGIDLNSCRPKDAPRPKATMKVKNEELKPHQALAAEAAAVLFGVQCNTYNLGKDGIAFVGREDNIALAEEAMFWIMRQVEALYKQNLPAGMTQRARSEYRKTFKAACAERVLHRAYVMMEKLRKDQATAKAATGQNALVVANYFDQLEQEVQQYWEDRHKSSAEQVRRWQEARDERERWEHDHPEEAERQRKQREREAKKEERRAAKRKGPRERSIPRGNGTSSGFAAGDNVKLRKDIS